MHLIISPCVLSCRQMVGVEYILLHAQEPILYIIRKQQRQSPTQGQSFLKRAHTHTHKYTQLIIKSLSLSLCSGSSGWLLHHCWCGVSGSWSWVSHQLQSGELTEKHTCSVRGCTTTIITITTDVCVCVCVVVGSTWDPVSVWWSDVVLPLSSIKRLLVAF